MWHVPSSMQSACAQALGCSMSDLQPDLSTWASTCERFSTLNGKPTPQQSWERAWKKEAYIQRLFGSAISPSSLQQSFEDWWIASLRDSHAKTLASLGNAPGLMAPAPGSSSTSSTLPTLAVRGASFWRTSQASLLPPPPLWTKPKGILKNAQPPESWENWPTAGGMRSGSLFQRPTWVPAMGGPGGSAGLGEAWATPDCNTSTYSNGMKGPNIRQQAMHWSTPNVCSPNSMRGNPQDPEKRRAAGHQVNLQDVAGHWATPRSSDGEKGGPNQAGSKGDLMLPSMAAQWPTPDAAMHGGSNTSPGPAGARPNITLAAQQWPTPASRDYRSPNATSYAERGGGG